MTTTVNFDATTRLVIAAHALARIEAASARLERRNLIWAGEWNATEDLYWDARGRGDLATAAVCEERQHRLESRNKLLWLAIDRKKELRGRLSEDLARAALDAFAA